MTEYSLTLDLPEPLYRRLSIQAQHETRTIGEIALERLARPSPPVVEEDLPVALRTELAAMADLSDEALWTIAHSEMNPDKVALYDVLLERQQERTLTAEGKELLAQLRHEADALALRKAHAFLLLQNRNHRLPSLNELRTTYTT
jgi:hypothetical protein